MRLKPALLLLVAFTLLGSGCAFVEVRSDELCDEIALFAESLQPGEERGVRFETAWGRGLKGNADVLYEKQCVHDKYEPGMRLCRYLMTNASMEFQSVNILRAMRCVNGDSEPEPGEYQASYELHGSVESFKSPRLRDDTIVGLEFSTGCCGTNPFLRIYAERFVPEP